MSAAFTIPNIDDNPDGWGPSTDPQIFKDVPYYTPFTKGDKLGRAADWQQQQYSGKSGRYGQKEPTSNAMFNYIYQDDDSSFILVDNTKVQPRKQFGFRRYQPRAGYYQQRQQQQQRTQPWQQQTGKHTKQAGKKTQANKNWTKGGRYGQDFSARKREPTVQVQSEWKLIQEIEFNKLNKLSETEPQATDLAKYGYLEFYDKSYERITVKQEKPLEKTDRMWYNVTTSDDPIIRKLSGEESSGKAQVYATDVILTHLMSCTRSVYPWDVIVTKNGSKIVFDARDNSNFGWLSVNETATDPPTEDSKDNSPSALSREATHINIFFSQQVVKNNEGYDFGQPNPFQVDPTEKATAVGYKYRRWEIGEDIKLTARCEVDAISEKVGDKEVLLTIKALNEWDPKSDWRKKLELQRGAVFATELKNNSFKLAKWTLQALLAATDGIKIGYVTRSSPKDAFNHVILAIQDSKPREFANQINLNVKNAWGILKFLVDLIAKQQNGKYILMKDPERNVLQLYSIPQDSFESTKEDNDSFAFGRGTDSQRDDEDEFGKNSATDES